ncbi:MAG: GGDEF domain-containing protein [Chloroflexi bacterium]|nr:GGDEF domain-containing protein [Chloroflexota bacterium]
MRVMLLRSPLILRLGHHTFAAWAFTAVLVAIGLLVAAWSLSDQGAGPDDGLALVVLAVLAAGAQLWPMWVTPGQARSVATPAFVFAGVLLLPPSLLTGLVALSVAPAAVLSWRRSEPPLGYAVSTAQVLLAAHAARLVSQPDGLDTLGEIGMLLAAIIVFLGLQDLLATALARLHGDFGKARTNDFHWANLAAELAIVGFGVAIAQIWMHAPWAIVFTLAPLLALAGMLQRFERVREAVGDEQTGPHVYRHIEGVLAREIHRAHRYRRPLSLLIVDIDFLRDVNDRHGYLVGDAVLQQLGALIKNSLRNVDLPLRFGGDEFLIILAETTIAEASRTAERLQAAISKHLFLTDRPGRAVQITVSIGVVAHQDHGETIEELLHRADLALYFAKTLGGNRVQVAASPEDQSPA